MAQIISRQNTKISFNFNNLFITKLRQQFRLLFVAQRLGQLFQIAIHDRIEPVERQVGRNVAMQIASIHNLAFYLWLVGEARKQIIAGNFSTWKATMVKRLSTRL